MSDIVTDEKGKSLFLLGNEAIVRGALEAGVDLATAYPGTPSSEIGNTFADICGGLNIYFEYSTNEKVATEVAIATSASGLRAMTIMKSVGLNVAADPLMTAAYTGVKGGFILVTADDPSCHSSQNEQDNRYYAQLAGIPMFEPSSPEEAREMTKRAFEISEELELPVLLRTTTRISHMRGPVTTGPLGERRRSGRFGKDLNRFITMPQVARERHGVLIRQMEKAEAISEKVEYNRELDLGGTEVGIVTSGASFNYAIDIIKEFGIKGKILKLGMTHPVPREMCSDFMKSVEKVVVLEELEPFLETHLRSIGYENNLDVDIFGKLTGHFSRLNEYSPDTVKRGLGQVMGLEFLDRALQSRAIPIPDRPPTLCPGCGHRHAYYAVKKALKDRFDEAIFSTDIGCYTLGVQPPLKAADFLLCMGSSVDAAGGFSKATDQYILAFIGDSTFFHCGIHGLINAVYNKHRFVCTILDNRTTAMTGHQPNPGMGVDGEGNPSPEISIEELVKACGVDFIRIVDPNDLSETVKAYEEALAHESVAVIIAERPCALMDVKAKGTFRIDQEDCTKCRKCIDDLGCPAILSDSDENVIINEDHCLGCGFCVLVCPFDSIKPSEGST
jgi:indolepyruvate ferredoxin oxidoreductase alpha subunit